MCITFVHFQPFVAYKSVAYKKLVVTLMITGNCKKWFLGPKVSNLAVVVCSSLLRNPNSLSTV